ncbi:MAG: LytTR family DNA-binding domain-containing protein [Syntrophomonadaceae bacterium]|nr:LytTR family DNA-binding domain-containing protein [Syntrophomonadaceae bacterium]
MNRVLILDDEANSREFLGRVVNSHPLVDTVLLSSNTPEAVKTAIASQPQLALLDIDLGAEDAHSGIDAARFIREISPDTEFIFVTGYGKYALESFAVHPYDFVLKPINKERLLSAVGKILSRQQINKAGRLVFRTRAMGTLFLRCDEVVWIGREARKSVIYCADNKCYETNNPIKALLEKLPSQFVRTHASYIINLDYVLGLHSMSSRSWIITLRDDNPEIPLSRNYYNTFCERARLRGYYW